MPEGGTTLPDEQKLYTVFLDSSLHRRVKATAALLEMTLMQAFDEALRDWLTRRQPETKWQANGGNRHANVIQVEEPVA